MQNSDLGRKSKVCFKKNWEKDDFFRFLIKNYATPVGFDGKFFTTGEKISKITFSRLVKKVEMKSHQI